MSPGARLVAALLVLATACGTSTDPGTSTTVAPRTPTSPATDTTTTTAVTPADLGEVTADEALAADGVPGRVHRVRYRSRSTVGEDIVVSGLLAVPDGPAPDGGWPVLAWAHGTTGVADRCAPSRHGAEAIPLLTEHLERGWAVAATDYEGLGTPGMHPYLVSGSEGRSVLDSARAARHLFGDDVADEVAVVGHSQGGHAALAAAELAADWAPELDLVGTVPLAPAADLGRFVPRVYTSRLAFGLGAYVAAGWPAAHPELDPADLLTPDGLAVVEEATGVCSGRLAELVGDRPVAELTHALPDDVDDWADRLADNSVHPDRVAGPVLVAQGSTDLVVPVAWTEALVDELCTAGVAVDTRVDPDAGHLDIVARSMPDVHAWLAERRAGHPVDGGGCADR